MITFLLGLPGSGKSYFAVDRIYNNFSDDKEAKRDKKLNFKNCYTNINEFNYDKVNNVHHLDFDKFYFILQRLHKHYKAKKSDKYLVKFLSRVKLKDTLFVIDEAHNFFDKKDLVLVWWLSYHRHLYHEIILITQNLALIESKYKSFSEFFYVAKPQSLTLIKSHFKYNVFCSSRLSQNSRSGSIKVKRKKEVFALYKSGDSIKSSNVILKCLLLSLAIALFLFAFIYYSYVYDSNKQQEQQDLPQPTFNDKKTIKKHNEKIINDDTNDLDIEEDKLLKLSCTVGLCSSSDIELPPQLLKVFLNKNYIDILYIEFVNKNVSNYYIKTSKNFYNFIKSNHKGEYNDKKGDNVSIFGTSSNS
jgi:zona occludens toxin